MRTTSLLSPASFLLGLTMVAPCYGGASAFMKEAQFSSSDIAECANHFLTLGDVAAIKQLREIVRKADERDTLITRTRICLLCRILFVPKGKKSLRPPILGVLPLSCDDTPGRRWPLYPIVRSGRSYFVLSQSYVLTGVGESASEYLDYCQQNGVFRKELIPLPTRRQAIEDLRTFLESPRWRGLTWPNLNRDVVIGYLTGQAERTREAAKGKTRHKNPRENP